MDLYAPRCRLHNVVRFEEMTELRALLYRGMPLMLEVLLLVLAVTVS